MIEKVHFRVLAAFLTYLFIFLSAISVEGTVLCFGEDGHVAIELVDSCNGAGTGSQFTEMEGDDCGPCKDILIISGPAFTGNGLHHMQSIPPVSLNPVPPCLPSKEYLCKYIGPDESPYHLTPAGLHSVVLLI